MTIHRLKSCGPASEKRLRRFLPALGLRLVRRAPMHRGKLAAKPAAPEIAKPAGKRLPVASIWAPCHQSVLAGVLHDLSATYSLEDLAGMLPSSETELKDSLEILRLPADLQAELRQQAREQEAVVPHPVTVVLIGPEHHTFERAMEAAKEQLGRNARRGQCLQRVCEAYLARHGDEVRTTNPGNDQPSS